MYWVWYYLELISIFFSDKFIEFSILIFFEYFICVFCFSFFFSLSNLEFIIVSQFSFIWLSNYLFLLILIGCLKGRNLLLFVRYVLSLFCPCSVHVPKGGFTDYNNLGWNVFSFSTLKVQQFPSLLFLPLKIHLLK